MKEHGIYVGNSGDRPIVRGNIAWGNQVCGIHMNGDVSQGGDGIISGALVENNVIFDNGRKGGSGINCDGVRTLSFAIMYFTAIMAAAFRSTVLTARRTEE